MPIHVHGRVPKFTDPFDGCLFYALLLLIIGIIVFFVWIGFVLTAQTLNIPAASSMTYATNASGIAATAMSANAYVKNFRAAPTLDAANLTKFDDEDRTNALGDAVVTSTSSTSNK